MAAGKFKIALIQLTVGKDKNANLHKAESLIREAAENNARVISLPECFNSPYDTGCFPDYAETIPGGITSDCLSKLARECRIYLIGGSIPEKDGDNFYNTCAVFGPQGDFLGKYRKMHLFDIDIPGKIKFKESVTLTGGSELFTFDTEWCKIGIGICRDIRFPELASLYAQKGCKLICYPAAFSMITGPPDWEVLIRAIALQNQLYVTAISPARDDSPGACYTAYGHSMISNPGGDVIASTKEKESIVYGEVDLKRLDEIREGLPLMIQKRYDVYSPVKVITAGVCKVCHN
ncbi:omega-amidase NIT2-like [Halichondria panicea]|uniref:omega-amidase NIT2-like n=1 Tax=Halichondria panicea TaxID=6063 RepID=UPI00312B826D